MVIFQFAMWKFTRPGNPIFRWICQWFPKVSHGNPMVSPKIHRNSRAASPRASPGPPHFLAKGWSKAWQDLGRPQMRRRHGESMGNPRTKHAKIMGKLTRNGEKTIGHIIGKPTYHSYDTFEPGMMLKPTVIPCHPTKWWLNLRRFDGEWFGPILYPSTMMALYCKKYQAISENKTCRNV